MLTPRTVTSVLVTTQANPTLRFQFQLPTAVLPAMEFVGRFVCAAPHTALLSPRSQSRVRQNSPLAAVLSALSRDRPGLTQGCEHRQEQAQGGGEAPTGNRDFTRAALPLLVLLSVITVG